MLSIKYPVFRKKLAKKEISRLIYWSIYYQQDTTANFDENLSSCEY